MNALSLFLLISRFEGVSFLVLVFIAMPLKHLAGMPLAVKYVGWAHGVLFMAYAVQLTVVSATVHWPIRKIVLAFLASLLPFGPFVFEKRYLES